MVIILQSHGAPPGDGVMNRCSIGLHCTGCWPTPQLAAAGEMRLGIKVFDEPHAQRDHSRNGERRTNAAEAAEGDSSVVILRRPE